MDQSPWHNNPNDPRTWGAPMHPADAQRLDWAQPGSNERWNTPVNTPYQPQPVGSAPFGDPNGMPVSMVPSFLKDVLAGSFIINVIFVGILWQVWVCLYPLSALAGGVTFAVATPVLRTLLPPTTVIAPGLFPVAGGIIAALVAGWNVCRLEEILAKSGLYRLLRHLVRLPLLGMSTAMALQKAELVPYDPSLSGIARVLRTPMNLEIVVGVMIASHFIVWNWRWDALSGIAV
jgi:hypothetical protein